jgi:heat shock protein HspQ
METNKEGWEKLAQVMDKLGAAKKDGKNPHFRSSYATLESCNAVIKPLLKGTGLALNHRSNPHENIVMTRILYNGEVIDSSGIRLPDDPNMQKMGSAITYAKRYNTCMLFNLDTEDDDGNATVYYSDKKANLAKEGRKITEAQIKRLFAIINKTNYDPGLVKEYIKSEFGLESSQDLDMIQYDKLCNALESKTL